jgi:hypothetical protein
VLGHDQALTAKFLDRLPDGHPSHAEVLDKLALGRELFARHESAELDPFPQEPGDLTVRWPIVGPVDLT